jgi:hypothetical protein
MPRYPGAEWRPLEENATQPRGRMISFVIHTHVGPKGGGYRLPPQAGQEYHFDLAVGGGLRQYMDTDVRADNNYKANGFTLPSGEYVISGSVETGDKYYDGDPGLTLNFSQLGQWDTLIDLCAWVAVTERIPVQWCPDPYGPGFGWHSMWRTETPNNPHDDTIWTKTASKTCPGPGKIAQLKAEFLPAVRARIEGDDMPTADEVADAVWAKMLPRHPFDNQEGSVPAGLFLAAASAYGKHTAIVAPAASKGDVTAATKPLLTKAEFDAAVEAVIGAVSGLDPQVLGDVLAKAVCDLAAQRLAS